MNAESLRARAKTARVTARRRGQPEGAGYLDGWADALDQVADELAALELADHPDADRPPGTSGSWGEA